MKVKPSEQLRRANEKDMDEAKKNYKAEMEKNKESIKEKDKEFFKMRKHYSVSKRRKRKTHQRS